MPEPVKKKRRQFRSELSMPHLAASALLPGAKTSRHRAQARISEGRRTLLDADRFAVLSLPRSARLGTAPLFPAQGTRWRFELHVGSSLA